MFSLLGACMVAVLSRKVCGWDHGCERIRWKERPPPCFEWCVSFSLFAKIAVGLGVQVFVQ